MKTFIPRHIRGGLFDTGVQLWPIYITLVQMVILAAWIGLSLAVWNPLVENGMDKVVAIIMVSPIFIFFVFVAFFRFTELTLIPFIAKIVKSNFLDEPVKFQNNYNKVDMTQAKIIAMKQSQAQQVVQTKEQNFDKDSLKKLDILS